MRQSTGSVSVSSLLAVAALVGLGVGGFNFVRTGCPLGSCASTAVTPVVNASHKEDGSCCPLGHGAEVVQAAVETKQGCCGGTAVGSEGCCGGCITDAKVTNVADAAKTDCATSCDSAKSCEGKDAAVTPVSNTKADDCSGKSDCDSAKSCEGKDAAVTPVSNTKTDDCSGKSGCDDAKKSCPAQTAAAGASAEKTAG